MNVHRYTLRPADVENPGPFGIFPDDAAKLRWEDDSPEEREAFLARIRRILFFDKPIKLTDEWDWHTTIDNELVEVRRANCGAGCLCAGVYRIVA